MRPRNRGRDRTPEGPAAARASLSRSKFVRGLTRPQAVETQGSEHPRDYRSRLRFGTCFALEPCEVAASTRRFWRLRWARQYQP